MSTRILALGRLLRLSLAPSALADAAAGIVAGYGAWPGGGAPWLLIGASACVYHGGMALNDWADAPEDARMRADRPIPSGAIPRSAALVLAALLCGAGVALALRADGHAGIVLALVALAAVIYDVAGRGPFRGPLLLGLCRAGNLGAGLVLGARLASPATGWSGLFAQPLLWVAPLLYGGYVFVVSRLGRLEDQEQPAPLGAQPSRLLWLAASLMLAVGLVVPVLPRTVRFTGQIAGHELPGAPWSRSVLALVLVVAGSSALLKAARRKDWTQPDVLRSMGLCLRRLLVLTAAVAVGLGARDGVLVGAVILCGYPASFWLRKVFPPS